MRHIGKDWYTCDRCGIRIAEIPSNVLGNHLIRKRGCKIGELKILTANRCGYISDKYLISPEISSVEITEHYNGKIKDIHLCKQCRRDFERFMKCPL